MLLLSLDIFASWSLKLMHPPWSHIYASVLQQADQNDALTGVELMSSVQKKSNKIGIFMLIFRFLVKWNDEFLTSLIYM